jgi:hypothetical protein
MKFLIMKKKSDTRAWYIAKEKGARFHNIKAIQTLLSSKRNVASKISSIEA